MQLHARFTSHCATEGPSFHPTCPCPLRADLLLLLLASPPAHQPRPGNLSRLKQTAVSLPAHSEVRAVSRHGQTSACAEARARLLHLLRRWDRLRWLCQLLLPSRDPRVTAGFESSHLDKIQGWGSSFTVALLCTHPAPFCAGLQRQPWLGRDLLWEVGKTTA